MDDDSIDLGTILIWVGTCILVVVLFGGILHLIFNDDPEIEIDKYEILISRSKENDGFAALTKYRLRDDKITYSEYRDLMKEWEWLMLNNRKAQLND